MGTGAHGGRSEILERGEKRIDMKDYTPPNHNGKAFNCPYCGVHAQQVWRQVGVILKAPVPLLSTSAEYISDFELSWCAHCQKNAVWAASRLVYPAASLAPLPSPDMPDDIRNDYEEARDVLARSPRSSAALLRLVIQKLCIHLGKPGKNLNADIGSLVADGLRPDIQQALDVVRVIGNNAVHPGELDLRDDQATALTLFHIVNLIVDDRITRPRTIKDLYSKLTPGELDQIARRDASKGPQP